MKKRNTYVLRRLLAVALALNLGVSTMAISVSADGPSQSSNPEDYVYVYINVTEKSIVTGETGPTPSFDENEAREKAGLSYTDKDGNTVEGADTALTEAEETLTEKSQVDSDLASKTESLKDATEAAQGALDDLKEAAKPTYPTETPPDDATQGDGQDNENGNQDDTQDNENGNQGDDQGVTQANGPDSTPEPEESNVPEHVKDANDFVDDANESILDLNKEQAATDKTVSAASDAANAAAKELESAKATLDEKIEATVGDLTGEVTKAETAAKDANDKVAEYDKKIEEKQQELQAEIDALPALDPEPTFAEGDDYDTYLAAHTAWENAVNARNDEITAIRTQHDTELAALNTERGTLVDEVAAVEKQIADLQAKLDAFKKNVEDKNYAELGGLLGEDGTGLDNAKIAELETAIAEYNKKLEESYNGGPVEKPEEDDTYGKTPADYNEKADAYNEAAKDYNAAAGDYNTAVADHKEAFGEAKTEYETAVTAQNDAADTYNNAAKMSTPI